MRLVPNLNCLTRRDVSDGSLRIIFQKFIIQRVVGTITHI